MDDLIAKLQERYGKGYDYSLLTEQQRAFLLAPTIANHKDAMGRDSSPTVLIKSITRETAGTLLSLLDHFNYQNRDSSPGGNVMYALGRIRDYKTALGLTMGPEQLEGKLPNYLFRLPDSSVQVEFSTYRDNS